MEIATVASAKVDSFLVSSAICKANTENLFLKGMERDKEREQEEM
jgi:hypothetical protein